jgi:hypothetical protein
MKSKQILDLKNGDLTLFMRDEFLSEEDLDLSNCSTEELYALWNMWLEQAQITNDEDADSYSHGVFMNL